MRKAKRLLFTLILAAAIMLAAAATLGSAQPVEAAPDRSYHTYQNYSDGTLIASNVFTDPPWVYSGIVYQPPVISWFWWLF